MRSHSSPGLCSWIIFASLTRAIGNVQERVTSRVYLLSGSLGVLSDWPQVAALERTQKAQICCHNCCYTCPTV
jgi:hypothetical protein